ncbi:MAG: DMT family transporter [Leptospirillia bacterium]
MIPEGPDSPAARRRRGTLAAWAVVLFWGFHYVVLYRPLRLVGPERYLILRFGWAAALVLLFSLFVPVLRGISRENWMRLSLLSLVGIVGYQWVFLKAASLLDPVSLVLILSLGPVLVALYSHARGHESFSSLQWAAMGLIGAGIYLVVRGEIPGGAQEGGSSGRITGLVMAGLSLVFFSVWTLMTRAMTGRVSTLQITLVPVLLGGLFLVPLHPFWLLPPSGPHSTLVILSLTYSIFVALFLAYYLWNVAVADIGPSRAGLWTNGQPVVAAAGSALFLHHPLGRLQLVGGLVAVLGYWLFFGRERPVKKAREGDKTS